MDGGDVTRVWYDDLYYRWKQGPAAIAGLTTPSALFVLETFGNDAQLRLQFKARHRISSAQVQHRLYGPETMLRSALPIENSGSRWSTHMARLICSRQRPAHFGRGETEATTRLTAGLPRERAELVSWVLAPRAAPCLL